MMKSTLLVIIVISLFGYFAGGCQTGEAPKPTSDESWKRNPYYWDMFQTAVDSSIRNEVAGLEPTGGKEDWDQFWKWRLRAVEKFPDRERCAKYIIVRRRKAGLPEL